MWHTNRQVQGTFIHHETQWSWAYIDTLGWLRVKDGAADGCSNLTLLLTTAKASGRPVNVFIDGTNTIASAYLL